MNVRKKMVSLLVVLLLLVMTACGSKNSETQPSASSSPDNGAKATESASPPEASKPALKGTLNVAVTMYNAESGVNAATGQNVLGYDEMVKPFLAQHPDLKVNFIQVPNKDSNTNNAKWQTLLLSNQVDIIQGVTMYYFYEQGLLEDLTPYFERDDYKKHFVDSIFSTPSERFLSPQWSEDAKTIYAAPASLATLSVAYDKQIFEDFGVEPLSQNPTMEEIMEKAEKLTGKNPKTGKQTYGLFFDPRKHSHTLLYYFGKGISLGEIDVNDPSKLTYNTPEVRQGIEGMIKAAAYAPPGFEIGQGNENWGTENNTVAIQMVVFPVDMLKPIQNGLQDRFMLTHGVLNKDGHGMFVAGNTYVMAKASENKEAAWELIKYMSGGEGQKFLYDNYGELPSWKDQNWVDESKDPYSPAFMAAAALSKNAFFPGFTFETFRPWMAGVVTNAVNGKTPDLDKDLAEMQKKAEQWVKEQEKK